MTKPRGHNSLLQTSDPLLLLQADIACRADEFRKLSTTSLSTALGKQQQQDSGCTVYHAAARQRGAPATSLAPFPMGRRVLYCGSAQVQDDEWQGTGVRSWRRQRAAMIVKHLPSCSTKQPTQKRNRRRSVCCQAGYNDNSFVESEEFQDGIRRYPSAIQNITHQEIVGGSATRPERRLQRAPQAGQEHVLDRDGDHSRAYPPMSLEHVPPKP